MPRPRKFQREELLDRAIVEFIETGVGAASVRSLIAALDIAPSSFYADFGDKHGLFDAALERYSAVVAGMLRPLSCDDAGLDDLEGFLRSLLDADTRAGKRVKGCLVASNLHATPGLPASTRERIGRHLSRQHDAFERVLTNAVRNGDARPDIDAAAAAHSAVVFTQGILLSLRAGVPDTDLETSITSFVAGLRLARSANPAEPARRGGPL